MTGRGIDQILRHPSNPILYESYMTSAHDYVRLAEFKNGPIQRPVEYAYIWGTALEEWSRARPDVRIVNLETSITRSEEYVRKGINYRMSPENVGCLLAAGIDCCVLANNHVLDWGRTGLIETLETLRRHQLKTCGAGLGLEEASAPAIIDIAENGCVIVFGCATPTSGTPMEWAATVDRAGVNLLREPSESAADAIGAEVRRVRRPGDVVVVSVHWGPNWGYKIPAEHRRFAHALIDRAGVSIVHGHSSHHPLGIEIYRGRLILYGCGDFLNDYEGITGYEEYRGDLGVMYFADIDAESSDVHNVEMIPLQVRSLRLNTASDEDTEWIRTAIDRESARFGARVERASGNRLKLSWRRETRVA